MLIGEVSRRTGLPPSAIRYYERVHVVPRGRRSRGGYRDFDESAVAKLSFIARAKEVGFSLPEITDLLSSDGRVAGAFATQELVQRKLHDVAAQRRSLLIVESRLRALQRQVKSAGTSDGLSEQLSRWLLTNEETNMSDQPLGAIPGFDSRAARVLRTAREVASELGHDWLGAEHLLIALAIESDGVAGTVLKRLGLTPVAARAAVLKIAGRGGRAGVGQTLTPRAQQLIGIAYGLALRDGRAADPDDLLLGLFSAGESIATTVVAQAGADLAALKRELLEAPHLA